VRVTGCPRGDQGRSDNYSDADWVRSGSDFYFAHTLA
jgi:hypothetical protein